jgi:hypothetical protein
VDVRLELAQRLAVELQRHGLERHLDQLRGYYRATRDGGQATWGDEHVHQLAQVLRVVPGLEVRPRGAGCCEGFQGRTVMHLADRYLARCSGCDCEWLVLLGVPGEAAEREHTPGPNTPRAAGPLLPSSAT